MTTLAQNAEFYVGQFNTSSVSDDMNSSTVSVTGIVSAKPSRDPLITLTVPAVMFGVGVLGNVLAIIVLIRSSREHKRTVFYRLVGALACTDLLGICATSPVTLAVYANHFKWVGGMSMCNYESFMLIFAGFSTILIICAMAIERFVSICHPFIYDKHVRKGNTTVGILILWSFAIVMAILPIIGLGENVIHYPGTWCFFSFTSTVITNKIFAYLYAIIGLVGILVTGISNFFVISVLIRMQRRAKKTTGSYVACNHKLSREMQMMVLMIGIVIIFTTCWCPFLIRIIINQINHARFDVKADLMTLRLASLNQILDPWIYILFRKQMFVNTWKFLKNLLQGKFRLLKSKERKQNQDSSENLKLYETEMSKFSMENNVDKRDALVSEISVSNSTTKTTTKTSQTPSMKSKHGEKSSLQKLMNQNNPQCFGLQHPACLFCFTNLPQAFVLSLGTEQKDYTALTTSNDENNDDV